MMLLPLLGIIRVELLLGIENLQNAIRADDIKRSSDWLLG